MTQLFCNLSPKLNGTSPIKSFFLYLVGMENVTVAVKKLDKIGGRCIIVVRCNIHLSPTTKFLQFFFKLSDNIKFIFNLVPATFFYEKSHLGKFF